MVQIPDINEFNDLRKIVVSALERIELLERELEALDYLTLDQASTLLKIKTTDVISKMMDKGDLEGCGIGRSRRVSRRSILAFIEKKKLKTHRA